MDAFLLVNPIFFNFNISLGITLWDKEQLQQSIRECPQINTAFNVTASDSIDEKSNLLNIDAVLN